ncbi:sulfatase family protein [Pontiella sulfatireligans]|nr:arylsulfatase [Pontiella sulfatireligans]
MGLYKRFLITSVIGMVVCSGAAAETPNVILIMADDLGYGDISCYGAKLISTPNIDKLARQGLRSENYYSAGSVCTPTRYSVLTGRYPFRKKEITTDQWKGYALIESERTTLANLFKRQGYKTAAVGKWHLGYGSEGVPDWGGVLKPGPNELGFDYHWGLPRNHNDNIRGYVENHRLHGLDPDTPFKTASDTERVQGLLQERLDDEVNAVLTGKVVDFIRANQENPFFVYFTPTIAHTHITPNVRFRGTSKAGQYGDFIQELDHYVGEIMNLLDELKLTDNTLIIFTSDNGGQLNDHSSAGKGLKLADESGDVALKSRTAKKDARKMGHKTNLDWREGKASPYQGGFRLPFIVRWPGRVDAGTTSAKLINSADYLATCADLLELDFPEPYGEDSFSFVELLTGEQVDQPRTNVALHSGKARCYVEGDWKVIDFNYGRKPKKKVELYNLRNDPAELKNLAKSNPERLKAMQDKLRQISKQGRSR